jgi:octaprenyl-diphosphate synthase
MTKAHAQSPTPQPSLASLQQLIADDMLRVNQVVLDKVKSNVPLVADLASHIIRAGGKRLRPALTIACAQLCGYQGDRHVRLAACVEFIHTATLLHDDVVDESKLRRGMATANDIWGNKSSVLVGDFLFSRSFQLMVEDGSLRVLEILANTAATIAEGEVLQLTTMHDPETAEEIYLNVVRAKTAALFAAAGELGAVVSDKTDKAETLYQFGLNLGIAFQLVDDALDYAGGEAALGKTIGDDFREGKITLPVILSYQLGDETQRAFWQRTLADMNQKDGDLQLAMEYIKKHQAIELTLEHADVFAERARKSLLTFPSSPMRLALEETVDFCVHRAY